MSLFQKLDNTIGIPLKLNDGQYLDPASVEDAVFCIYSKCGKCKLFEASLSAGGITIVTDGINDLFQIEISSSYNIAGQVKSEMKLLLNGKWRGSTLSPSTLGFIPTEF
jgi:hypothetical protein